MSTALQLAVVGVAVIAAALWLARHLLRQYRDPCHGCGLADTCRRKAGCTSTRNTKKRQ